MNPIGGIPVRLQAGDALIVVDMQNDFLPGGSLAVSNGDEVIPVLNGYVSAFQRTDLPIFATRDCHPPNHCSFKSHGGPWPIHCVVNSRGAAFALGLKLPASTAVISKPTARDRETYDGFEGTDLENRLHEMRVGRLFVGGLATDYCVLNTTIGGL